MKYLLIVAIAVAVILVATNVLRAHLPGAIDDAGVSLQVSKIAAGVSELPTEEYEDMSLVFSRAVKR